MPKLQLLVLRRANPMNMGTAASALTSSNSPSAGSKLSHQNVNLQRKNQEDKSNGRISELRYPLLRKESSAVNLILIEKQSSHIKENDGEALLLRPESSTNLEVKDGSWLNLGPSVLRKCETAVGLSSIALESGRPVNRSRICLRCSSLLSLTSGSRHNLTTGNSIPTALSQQTLGRLTCKLCWSEVCLSKTFTIEGCGCSYCTNCMRQYLEFEIEEGAYEISCPDAGCENNGMVTAKEMSSLVPLEVMDKHHKFRLNRDVAMDKAKAWCPKPGCETICSFGTDESTITSPMPMHCPNCASNFCFLCKEAWHSGPCSELPLGILFDSDHIKCCPMCSVPIEKDEGCAQMMCKRCKHVFCWYCLASLDDDFLLRHYDKGPCKNKLGHSRASVIWHRTQVIGIFAGFGLLLLVASPLLLLAAPCIVCCKCRMCGSSRLEQEDGAQDESLS